MGSSLAVAAVNLAVAAGCLMVDRLSGRGGEPQPATKDLFHSAHTACEQTGLPRPVPSTPLAWACSHPGILVATTPAWFLTVAAWAGDPQASSPTAFALWITFVAALTLGPAILAAGLVGAELENRVLLSRCGLHGPFGVIGLAYAAAAVAIRGR